MPHIRCFLQNENKLELGLRSQFVKHIMVLLLFIVLSLSQLAIFEFENFRGKKVELSGECKDVFEKAERVGSVIVESGP